MNKSSILFIDTRASMGGGQVVLDSLLKIAIERFSDIGLAAPSKLLKALKNDLSIKNNIACHSIEEINLNNGHKNIFDFLRFFLYTLCFFKKIRFLRSYDIWYINSPRALIPSCFVNIILRKKIVFHIHSDFKKPYKFILLFLLMFGFIEKIVCCSKFISSKLKEFNSHFSNKERFIILENSLSKKYSDIKFQNRFTKKIKVFNVGIPGWISKEKGQEHALSMLKYIENINIFVIGNPMPGSESHYKRLKRVASKNTYFIEHNSESYSSLIKKNDIHICIMPTLINEAFGLMAIESMACSCILISSAHGGLRDISNVTDHFTYKTDMEFIAYLKMILNKSNSELTSISRNQYLNTQNYYAFSQFKNRIISFFNTFG
jgi:glycosyltransferase involved in cell wall biosynthesis